MSKVYLYSRVSTDQQSLEQQERTVYEWLKHHNMSVDEVVSDEGVSGGVSYKGRKLGKELLPKMVAGDTLICSEISRLGRSMFDLSKLIHEDLKPKKIRLVVVGMGLDLRCDALTAMDELILNNFAFAAQLEKQLISERTKSSLAVKKAQGVKLGAASDVYRQRYNAKSEEERERINRKKGAVKTQRHHESLEFLVNVKITKSLFPDATTADNPKEWRWNDINFSHGVAAKDFIERMKAYKELDTTGKLYAKWDFEDVRWCRERINPYFGTFKRSCLR